MPDATVQAFDLAKELTGVPQDRIMDFWREAVRQNNLTAVKDLKAISSVNPNTLNRDGYNLAAYAIMNSSSEIIDIVISLPDFDINAPDKHGYTLLMRAIQSRGDPLAEKLLAVPGIDINLHGKKYGETALIMAVRANQLSIVKMLFRPDIKIDEQDFQSKTALDHAEDRQSTHQDCEELIALLRAAGAAKIHKNSSRPTQESVLQFSAVDPRLNRIRAHLGLKDDGPIGSV